MVTKKIITILVAVLLVSAANARAVTDKDFYSNGVIQHGDEYSNVGVYDTVGDHTIVDMTGGTVDSLCAHHESIVNVGGGDIAMLRSRASSSVNVFGGSIYELYADDRGTVHIWDNAHVDILRTRSDSMTTVAGGTLGLISASRFGSVNLIGGLIYDYLAAGDSGIINIYGYHLTKIDTGGHYGSGFVSGEWLDKTAFNIDLSGPGTYSRIIFHEIPEPATVLLIVIGSVCLGKRRSMKEKT
ncbi:MAG TPA: PEP-CTERM sorting domain-containing protein [Planctomycetes bacterium]|nr:PEP-CTERM sorting domain-containing protein [Planctomycetota bacterium]